MKKFVLFLLVLSSCVEGTTNNLHVENDVFNPFQKNQDRYFTHGTRFGITKEKENEQETWSIGQNIFTPSTKKPDADLSVLDKDRPYAGWLYGEYRDKIVKSKTLQDTWGLQLGCLGGSCSLAKKTQQGFHKLIGQGKPAWLKKYELKNEPGVIGELEREKKVLNYDSNADLSFYSTGKLGNIIDSVALGSNFRLGYNLDTFASTPIVFKLPPPPPINPWTAYLSGKIEQRVVLYNQLLDGSLFQSEPHRVHSEPFVNEVNVGITFGYSHFKFSYTYFRFSQEWEEKNTAVAFSGLDFEW